MQAHCPAFRAIYLLAAFAWAALSAPAAAGLESALPAEAPKSLFSASLGTDGESDAELFVSGVWSASVIGSLSFQSTGQGGDLQLSSASPILFTQDPDVFLSFLLFKKLFVEAKVSGKVEEARFAAGYRGGEEDALKEARIGNEGISFPSIPFLSFAEGSYRSFGASARIERDNFVGRAMIRYDQAKRVSRKFVGSSEIVETVLSPDSFISGKYFATARAPVTGLQVFVQSASGSLSDGEGRSYRKLGSDEYSYSVTTGFIALKVAAKTRVAAFYPGSGEDSSNNVALAGVGDCDLLYEPPPDPTTGSISPRLQILCRYALVADPASSDAYVLDAASGQRDTQYEARIDPSGYVEVIRGDTVLTNVPSDRETYRRPFEGDMSWLYTTDFSDPTILGYAPVFTKRIVIRKFSPASSISIDKDAIAGSVEIRRNGVQDFAFTVDTDNSIVKLASPPSLAEEIEVSYMRESSQRRSGMLSAALGGFWKLAEGSEAWAALGTSWSVPGTSYSADGETSSGRVTLTAGAKTTGELLSQRAAFAAVYTRADATGRYRVEGMEGSGAYASSLRPASGTDYAIVETKEDELGGVFPDLVRDLHRDGSVQQALRIEAGASASASATFEKIIDAPPFESFKTFSFYARIPQYAELGLSIDNGAGSEAISIMHIPGTADGSWRRYILRYGSGDARVYVQADEDSPELPMTEPITHVDLLRRASRIVISVSGLGSGQTVWIDEICLEDSIGNFAAIGQAALDYANPKLRLGRGDLPLLSGLTLSLDAQGSVSDDSYASGGLNVKTNLGFLGLGVNARGAVASASGSSLRGGHELVLPSVRFPLKLSDSFDYDPASGSFGRQDSLSASFAPAFAAELRQKTAWTAPASLLAEGLWVQEWSASMSLAGGLAKLGLEASNRATPAGSIDAGRAGDYASAWIGSFAYALPALEEESDRRSFSLSLGISGKKADQKIASISIGGSAEPRAGEEGIRRNLSSIRLGLPMEAKSFSISPYYQRAWKDKRSGAASGLVGDAALAFSDFGALPAFYAGIPFAEMLMESSAADFAAQTADPSSGIEEALLSSEAGVGISRELGSSWGDFFLPSALSLACRRELSRSSDQIGDRLVAEVSGKWTAVNVFGALGSNPAGLGFDSDEYLGILKASFAFPRGSGLSETSINSQFLGTIYAGASVRLDVDNTIVVKSAPSSGSWSELLKLTYSKKVSRHLLLDAYRLAVPEAEKPQVDSIPDHKTPVTSVASSYLAGLAGLKPTARSIYSISVGIDGISGDATGTRLGFSVAESYEARVTVPERVTLKAIASFAQRKEAASGTLSLGFELSLGAVISF